MPVFSILIFVVFIVLFWMLIMRPQQQQRRVHQQVVAELHVGQRVMTVGGLIGTLTLVEAETVRLDVGDGTEVTFGRTFIRQTFPVTPDEPEADPDGPADHGADASDAGDPR